TRWMAASSLAALVLLSGLIIRIRTKDGQTTTIEAPDGATVEVVEVVRSKEPASPTSPPAQTRAVPSRPLLAGARPILVKPGEPLHPYSLVSRPPAIDGLR